MWKIASALLLLCLCLTQFETIIFNDNNFRIVSYCLIGISYLQMIMILALKCNQKSIVLSLSDIVFIFFQLYVLFYTLYLGYTNPESIIYCWSIFFFYFVAKIIKVKFEWLIIVVLFVGLIQAVYGLGQFMKWFSNITAPYFRMSGSFDNPAGFAATLSVCFPFALFLLRKKEIYWKISGISAAVLIIVAVILSQSRAGIIAIIVISGIWAIKSSNQICLKNWSRHSKIAVSTLLVVVLLVGLYFLKKDSADGRLLIWQCSARMIVDKPLFGHGIGGFQREYMLYQAEYFRNHPDSSFAMLADIVKHPFNEYLLFLVEHGLVGGLLLGLFVCLLIRQNRKNKSIESFYAMLCLVGIGVFACFSYPMSYPFARYIAVFCAALILKHETKRWEMPSWLFFFIKPVALVVSIALLVITCIMFYNEYRWNSFARRSLEGETKAVMNDYAHLYKTMNRNGLFLYNYAAELNFIDRNAESNRLFIEASHFMNDIDLQLQMADNYQKLKQYEAAEKCLLLASEMIPNRFIPLYRLAKLYEKTNQIEDATKIAKLLINKPVKMMSWDIMTIKMEMYAMLRK